MLSRSLGAILLAVGFNGKHCYAFSLSPASFLIYQHTPFPHQSLLTDDRTSHLTKWSPQTYRALKVKSNSLKAVAGPATSVVSTTYMMLLALQFAVQPILTKKYAPKTIIRSTYVLAQDFSRLAITATLLTLTSSWGAACRDWSLANAVATAGIPAVLYMLQSYCSLTAYQNLSPLTYNVLNQTKTLSAAFWCFFLLGQRQSPLQMISLCVLLLSALVMESIVKIPYLQSKSPGALKTARPTETAAAAIRINHYSAAPKEDLSSKSTYFWSGILPILAASLISGLAGAWTQRSLQLRGNSNSLLFTLQLSVFSISSILMGLTFGSPDRRRGDTEGWIKGWTKSTWIPIGVNATGGVLVGLVTKTSGAVPKGFALICGMFLSGILQNVVATTEESSVSGQQWTGGVLAAISVWMHSAFPMAQI